MCVCVLVMDGVLDVGVMRLLINAGLGVDFGIFVECAPPHRYLSYLYLYLFLPILSSYHPFLHIP